jgi:hypothetical protein
LTDLAEETLINDLIEWANDPKSYTIPQFIAERHVSWDLIHHFVNVSSSFALNFDVVKAYLHCKWMDKAWKSDKALPQHQAKILLKYVNAYDSHARFVDLQDRMKIAEIQKQAELEYIVENYAADREKVNAAFNSSKAAKEATKAS